MTTPIIKIKVFPKPSLKGKMDVHFPANVVAGSGIDIVRSDGTYTFLLDYASLGEVSSFPDAFEATTYFAAYESTQATWSKISVTNLKADLTATFGGLYQPLDATLTALAALDSSAGLLTQTAADTFSKTALGTGVAAFLTTPSSANLRAALTDETGTGIAYFVGGALGTPASATLTNATGLPIATGISGLGTGIATALAVNVGTAGAPVINGGALGTPSSGTATNITGLPISTGVSGLAAGAATFLATPSSANLRALLTDEVGTGAAYFVGGALGTPASGTATNLTGLPLSTGISGAGTGVLAALAVNVGSAGAPVLFNGALGTPSSGTLTNATGLPLAGLATQAAYSLVGNFTGSSAVPTASTIPALTNKASPVAADKVMIADSAAADALKYATIAEVVGALASGVSSIAGNTGAFTLGYGLTNSTNDLRASLTSTTNSLGSDVALNNISNYFVGPTVSQGSSGTWLVTGTVQLTDPTNPSTVICKLWDGTTVIDSCSVRIATALVPVIAALSGVVTSPAGNLRIECKSSNITTVIAFNASGNSKDSTITAVRIAP